MISIENVSIDIPFFEIKTKKLFTKKIANNSNISNGSTSRVLNNINVIINANEKIGLIGKNGAGKTSLLKLIAGFYPFEEGKMTIDGSVSSVINSTDSLFPDATGIENIKLQLLRSKISKQEIDNRILDIADFSELDSKLLQPIKTMSLGMKVKIVLSVAINLNNNILVIDEDINALDEYFFNKLLEKIKNINVLIIATHDLKIIKKVCSKCIHLENGSIKKFGLTDKVISNYKI
jgi:ABC-type polysaccharide/polyol phosphate transport system ATPase subunit